MARKMCPHGRFLVFAPNFLGATLSHFSTQIFPNFVRNFGRNCHPKTGPYRRPVGQKQQSNWTVLQHNWNNNFGAISRGVSHRKSQKSPKNPEIPLNFLTNSRTKPPRNLQDVQKFPKKILTTFTNKKQIFANLFAPLTERKINKQTEENSNFGQTVKSGSDFVWDGTGRPSKHSGHRQEQDDVRAERPAGGGSQSDVHDFASKTHSQV